MVIGQVYRAVSHTESTYVLHPSFWGFVVVNIPFPLVGLIRPWPQQEVPGCRRSGETHVFHFLFVK